MGGRMTFTFGWQFILSFMILVSFLAFANTYLPPEMQFINTFDYAFFGGSIIAVGGVCVIATGIPCAIALAVFGVASWFTYIVIAETFSAIKLLIFVPIVITLIYIMVKELGRG